MDNKNGDNIMLTTSRLAKNRVIPRRICGPPARKPAVCEKLSAKK